MGKKRKGKSMNKYRITAGVAALLMGMATPAAFFDADTVSCEKVYDVRLSAETVEIDINDIPENREVQVGINLDNNPGMKALGFWIEKDSRLSCDEARPYEIDRSKYGVGHGFHENGNILDVNVIPVNNEELSYDNGTLFKMKFVLPLDYKAGDFYDVKVLLDFNDSNSKLPGFYRADSFDEYFGRENFADPVAGGIRITGQKNEPEPSKQPEPEPSPSPSPEQKPSDQQAGNNNSQPSSDNNSEKKQETQAVTSAVSETVSTSVSETVDTSVTVSETSVSESETAVTSVSETEVTDETTAVSATTVTEEISEEKKENKNRSIYLAGVAIIATILGVAGAYSIRHNKK